MHSIKEQTRLQHNGLTSWQMQGDIALMEVR